MCHACCALADAKDDVFSKTFAHLSYEIIGLLQGLPSQKLHTVFQAIVSSRLLYGLPAWGPLLNLESE